MYTENKFATDKTHKIPHYFHNVWYLLLFLPETPAFSPVV